jgi:hypothetical protein
MERFLAIGYTPHESIMLADAHQAVIKTNLWDYLRLPSTPGKDGFMFCTDLELVKLSHAMKYDGHSGVSYAWTMRQMEYIAKNGWDAFERLRKPNDDYIL